MNAKRINLDSGASYTLSELIALLTAAKERWGNKEVWIRNQNTDSFYQPITLCLHEGFEYHDLATGKMDHMEDTVCIE